MKRKTCLRITFYVPGQTTMQVIHDLSEPIEALPTVLTIGMFDGVHLGHQALIGGVVQSARDSGRRAAVLTFFPHPQAVLSQKRLDYLSDKAEKLAMFEQLGLDLSVEIEFTPGTAQMRADVFAKTLNRQLGLSELWVGHDFALGYKREGNVTFLRQAGQTLGFTVNEVKPSVLNGERISSSRIRAALRSGDVGLAQRYLGRPYHLGGVVVEGARRGHALGIPTANLAVWAEKAVPAGGVYAGLAQLEAARLAAVVNIGTRPTFDNGAVTIEAHLLDFDGDLYGQHLSLDFIARLRGEQRFESVPQLIAQVQSDIRRARDILASP
ncbi:MAG: bifunctional riboflavin kinase/FAD synthetase [Thermoflexales bacterium]|nr:bifunctional riboflavin kinase/FAD synthetase [Thermoflexales bacterium]